MPVQEQPSIDLIGEVLADHEEIKRLFARVRSSSGEEKTKAFSELVRKLAVHETAEEIVVHPLGRNSDSSAVVDDRLHEEEAAKKMLSTLASMDCDNSDFDPLLASFERDVLAHADREERMEHPLIMANTSAQRLRTLATIYRLAEATAPTHPHPMGPSSAMGNVLVGPFVAIVDRTRDLLTAALERAGL